jgi:ribonuclease P protein subunit POP4
MITSSNLPRHELIGLQAEVVASTNRANLGLKGKVVDESLRTLVIETARAEKRIFKNQVKMQFILPGGKKVELSGSLLEVRPWDRVKKKLK